MDDIVLSHLVSVHNELWLSGKDESHQTKLAQLITKNWQERVVTVDLNRYKSEFLINTEKKFKSHKIDLVDMQEKTAYELKVSPNNPHHEFYRDIFKILYANSLNKIKFNKFIFCCPKVAINKLGDLGSFVASNKNNFNIKIELFGF